MFTRTFMPSLDYAMLATYISEADWDYIISPALSPALSKSGIVSTALRKFVFTSICLQGFGLFHLFFKQHLLQLGLIVMETQSLFSTRIAIVRMVKELWHQAEFFGYLGNILKDVLEATITDSWLKALLLFAGDHNVYIQDQCQQLVLQRQSDSSLMSEFVRLGYKSHQLRDLKRCCDFARVVSVSNVATFDGLHLQKCVLPMDTVQHRKRPNGTEPCNIPKRCLDWPLFKTAVSKLANSLGVLKIPLGKWLVKTENWFWLFSPSSRFLFKREGQLLIKYSPLNLRPPRNSLDRFVRVLLDPLCNMFKRPVPKDLVGADVDAGASVVLQDFDAVPFEPSVPEVLVTLEQSLMLGHPSSCWAVQHLVHSDNSAGFAQAIADDAALMVLDGWEITAFRPPGPVLSLTPKYRHWLWMSGAQSSVFGLGTLWLGTHPRFSNSLYCLIQAHNID